MFYVPTPTDESSCEALQSETSANYETELKLLWNGDIGSIKNHVLLGNLRTSKLRSLYWKILLGVIPPLPSEWLSSIRNSRSQYDEVKSRFTLDPHHSSGVPNDNPLSQDTNSVWYRYFCDKELKRVIRQDVVRTSPERPFFQLADVQEIMISILFAYARLNPDICYRQGMHEILAAILYVLHEDCQNFKQISEPISVINTTMSEILDTQHLEKDAFCLFSHVMRRMGAFYQSSNNVPNASGHFPSVDSNQMATDKDEESGIGFHLTEIRKKLAEYDWQLDKHLEKLCIPFTAFGIRWIRLLFGREFAFADLLVLWDAIFAIDSNFILVNYILIAMLVAIRDKLLNSDYVECLNYLMKYPDSIDVVFVIELALHFHDATIYKKPSLPKISKPAPVVLPVSDTGSKSTLGRDSKSKSAKKPSKVKPSGMKQPSAMKQPTGERSSLIFDPYSPKSFDLMVSEVKHMRVVMSLCKLKLYQYHDILTAAVDPDDVNAQHALTGIHELCTLLDIDHFSLNSSPNTSPLVEPAYEAGEVHEYLRKSDNEPSTHHPSADAVAMYLPPPKSEIDMTIFSRTECAFTDTSKFPLESPHKAGVYK